MPMEINCSFSSRMMGASSTALLIFLLHTFCCSPSFARTIFAARGTFGDDHGPFTSPYPSPNTHHHLPLPFPSPSRHSYEQNLPTIMAFMRELSSESVEKEHKLPKKPKEVKSRENPTTTKAGEVVPIVVRQSSNSNSGSGSEEYREYHYNDTELKSDEKEMISYEQISKEAESDERPTEQRREEFLKKIHQVPIKDDHAMELYQHWTNQAFSNLFAVIANQKLKDFEKPVHDEFGECCKRAQTVPMHAKCVSDLMNGHFDGAKFYNEAKSKTARFDRYRMKKRGQFRREMMMINNGTKKGVENDEWVGSFRMMDSPTSSESSHMGRRFLRQHPHQIAHSYTAHRRERRQTGIVKKNYYELLTPSAGKASPLGQIAQMMMKQVLKAKGKQDKDVIPWQRTVQKIQNSARRRKELRKKLEEDPVESMDQLTYRGLKRQGAVEDDLNDIVENPEKLNKFLERKRKGKGKAPIDRFVKLLREGLKLGYAFAGRNMSNFDNKTLKTLSPRFLSVTPEQDPEQNDTIDFLSPSLFSLHNSGIGLENLTSLPNILNNIGGPIGFSAKDQQLWLDFIMEAAGVVEDAEKIETEMNETAPGEDPLKKVWEKHYDKERYEREIRTKDGTPLYFTRNNISDGFGDQEARKVDTFETLQKMMNRDQVKDMNRTGFALMTRDQLDLLYGPNSEYHDPEAIKLFTSMNKSTILQRIEQDIHSLAQIKSFKITRKNPLGTGQHSKRSKRAVVLSPISFSPFVLVFLNSNPIILSPIIFSPLILAPAVLGPVILSPWAFVPVILSPRLLSPLVLSPPIFAPVVLSPLALHPIILSPGVFVPFVLSPVLMAPFILSPQVFTPFILSPLALSPFIFNPAVGSPLVLSPFVLTPIIFSPMAISALVLSPYALSPVIQSPLIAYAVILSPSYLS